MSKISIILPVYNVDKYLRRCLDSLQPYINYGCELIIVNDGSTDSSQNIIDHYCHDNPCVISVFQQNAGLSAARNTGLKYVNQEYVWFVDSDDYVENITDKLDKLLCTSPDIIILGRNEDYGSWRIHAPANIEDARYMNGEEYLKISIRNGSFRTNVWDKIFKKDVIVDNNLRFVEGLLYEDMHFTVTTLMCSQSVVTARLYPYNYIHYNTGSITKTIRFKDLDVLQFIQLIDEYLVNKKSDFNNSSSEFHKLIFNWVSSCLLNKYAWRSLYNMDAKFIFSQTITHPIFQKSAEYCRTHNVGLRQKIFAALLLNYPTLYRIVLPVALKIQYIKQWIQSRKVICTTTI